MDSAVFFFFKYKFVDCIFVKKIFSTYKVWKQHLFLTMMLNISVIAPLLISLGSFFFVLKLPIKNSYLTIHASIILLTYSWRILE